MSNEVEIDVEVKAETERAYLVESCTTGEEAWIPKSQVTDYCEEDGVITSIFIKQWLAEEKELV